MSASLSTARYDRKTIALHWLTVLLVLALWGIAQIIDDFPRGDPRVMVRSIHILLGVVLGGVLIYRLVWRVSGSRHLPDADTGLAKVAALATHYGLYALLAAAVLLGLANAWMRGDSVFGLFTVPAFDPNNHDLRHTVGSLHGTVANIILIVAGIHGAAALGHHYVLKDNVLRRMLPARS